MSDSNKPLHLTCESLVNPMGLDRLAPRLSWWVGDARPNALQSAYEIHVASSVARLVDEPDLWNTGKVQTDQSVCIAYAGKPLISRQCCYWRVRTWDANDTASPWSDTATFEMGLLKTADWQALWIKPADVIDDVQLLSSPLLRKPFSIDPQPTRARLYITSLGLYDCYINGQSVTDSFLRPGWTDYRRRVAYQVYDVTDLLAKGENAIGVMLGHGWYSGYVGCERRHHYGKQPQLLAQLHVKLADGSQVVVVSDNTWKSSNGPVVCNDLLMGETYDARLEQPGWSAAGFDDGSWSSVERGEGTPGRLVGSRCEPVRHTQTLTPIADPVEIEKGRWVFDLGQNMVGWVRLRLTGMFGQSVQLRHAEALNDDGTLYCANLRSAKATDVYIFSHDQPVTYEPRFTYHGFRYVELSGVNHPPEREAISGIVVHSDMPVTGHFECSDPLINQLQSNITWGQRGNFLEIPTDCPQRDERLGWTGDAQIFARTAAFNMQVLPFFTKWIDDLVDAQTSRGTVPPVAPMIMTFGDAGANLLEDSGPAWADAMVICPWTMYLCYGDTGIIQEHYDKIKRFVDVLHANSHDFLRCDRRYSNEHCWGDWLNQNAHTSDDLIGTAFLAYCTKLFSDMADAIGQQDDAACYRDLAVKTRKAFCEHFLTPAGRLVSQTQTAYALGLYFDLLPENQRQDAADWLAHDVRQRGNHLSTGFVGTPYLLHVLSRFGHLETAYDLLTQKTCPGWLYQVTQGATTIWERWDSYHHERGFGDASMNSFNHYAYGAVGSWLYQTIAGIEPDSAQPGYKHIHFAPRPGGGLNEARAVLESVYGLIRSHWRIEDNQFILAVTVPANTTATVSLPDGRTHAVGSGDHRWIVRMSSGNASLHTPHSVSTTCDRSKTHLSEPTDTVNDSPAPPVSSMNHP